MTQWIWTRSGDEASAVNFGSTTGGRVIASTDGYYRAESLLGGMPVAFEVWGSGFGATRAGLAGGTAVVERILFSRTDTGGLLYDYSGMAVTGAALQAWWNNGNQDALRQAAFAGPDTISLSDFGETVHAYGGNDTVFAYGGNDSIYGEAGDDRLFGGDGNDWLLGQDGSDILLGDAGDDLLTGQSGNDRLAGGLGNDTMTGDAGFDVIVSAALRKQVTITNPTGNGTMTGPEGNDSFSGIEAFRFVDGYLGVTTAGEGSQVTRLYLAALGRAPDLTGLSYWTHALIDGVGSLHDIASGFLGSPEFASRFGAPDPAGFVTLLYQNVMGRAPDADGMAYWTGQLQAGAPPADVLIGFSQSAEFIARVGLPEGGLFAPDPTAIDVTRYYQAIFNRAPDAGGLSFWVNAHDSGTGLEVMADSFVASAEFQATYASLSDAGFVDLLYHNALGRAADAEGIAYWTARLGSGAIDRGDVVGGFAFSDELLQLIAPRVSDGIAFA